MLSLHLYIGAPIFRRTSFCCLFPLPAFFGQDVAWCHHTFALFLFLRFFPSCHLIPCFSAFLFQSLSRDHPLHVFQHLPNVFNFSYKLDLGHDRVRALSVRKQRLSTGGRSKTIWAALMVSRPAEWRSSLLFGLFVVVLFHRDGILALRQLVGWEV